MGLISPDRTSHPGLREVKKVYQYVKVTPVDIDKGKIKIKNIYDFLNLNFTDLKWELLADGIVIGEGEVKRISIDPQMEQSHCYSN